MDRTTRWNQKKSRWLTISCPKLIYYNIWIFINPQKPILTSLPLTIQKIISNISKISLFRKTLSQIEKNTESGFPQTRPLSRTFSSFAKSWAVLRCWAQKYSFRDKAMWWLIGWEGTTMLNENKPPVFVMSMILLFLF